MARVKPPCQTLPEPAQTAYSRLNPLFCPNETEDYRHRHVNSRQTNTDASVISAANFDPNSFPNAHDPVREWEPLPRPVMRSTYGYIQETQANIGLPLPRYEVPVTDVLDHDSLVSYQQPESQSDFLSSLEVEMPDGAEIDPGSHYLPHELTWAESPPVRLRL